MNEIILAGLALAFLYLVLQSRRRRP